MAGGDLGQRVSALEASHEATAEMRQMMHDAILTLGRDQEANQQELRGLIAGLGQTVTQQLNAQDGAIDDQDKRITTVEQKQATADSQKKTALAILGVMATGISGGVMFVADFFKDVFSGGAQ